MVIHGANSEHPDLYIYCMLAAYALADMLSDVDDSRVLFSSHRATWIHSARDGLSSINFCVYTVSSLVVGL